MSNDMPDRKDCLLPFLKNGITQVAWVVQDLDKAVMEFYDKFGIGPWHYYRYGHPLLKIMRRRGKEASFCMKTAVANAGATRLELIEPLEGDTIYNEFVEKNGFGKVHHFGIAIDNMKDALDIVKEAGIAVTMEGSGYGLDGDGYFAYLDVENILGIALELMERPKRRHIPEKIYPNPDVI